ncbi:MAG TPA: hypothetical protein VIL46_16860, partial [Gemmataceae bacterium]
MARGQAPAPLPGVVGKRQLNLVCALAYSPDGTLLASRSRIGTVGVWDVATGKLLECFTDRPGGILCFVCFSPDGQYVLSGSDGTRVRRWRVAGGRQNPLPETAVGNFGAVSADGRTFASACYSTRQTIDLYETATGKNRAKIPAETRVESLALSPNGRWLAANDDARLRVWELPSGRERCRIDHAGGLCPVTFSADGKTMALATSRDGLFVVDVDQLLGKSKPTRRDAPTADELKRLWADLIGDDAVRAYRTIHRLAEAPRASARFLGQKLKPAEGPPAPPRPLAALIREADGPDAERGERAAEELRRLGGAAEPALRRAILAARAAGKPRVELEDIYREIEHWRPAGEELRMLRAVEALELMGGADAQAVLNRLAKGGWAAHQTRETQAALE